MEHYVDREYMIAALSEVTNMSPIIYENMEDEEIETKYEAIVINEATSYAK